MRLAAGFAAVLPPLSKGGGTAEGRDGGIALRRALRRSGLPRNIKFIRRGGIYPARGVCAAAGFPGAQCAPLQGARWGWLCGWPQVFPSARRGGFHIRPQTSRHRKPGRYRIGPYNISTKIFIPPKKPETPPTHKTQKPKKAPKKPQPPPASRSP